MNNNKTKIGIVIGAFILFGLSVGLSYIYIHSLNESNDKYFNNYNRDEKNVLGDIIAYQQESDRKIERALNSNDYTLDEPYILENPYKINPLAAVVAFNTKYSTSVDVYINDTFVYTVKDAKKHIIPIYGLYNNAVNIVKLVTKNNSKELEIKTNLYNYNTKDINIEELIDEKSHYFLLNNVEKNETRLRGFNSLGSLIYYLDLDHISGVKFYNTRLYVGYNAKGDNLKNIKLEMDYLGKIYGISTDLSDLDNLDKDSYVGTNVNIYRKKISNVDLTKVNDNLKYTEYLKVSTKEIEKDLENALVYEGEFKVSMNGDYLTYDIDEKGMLLLVNKNTFYTYKYYLDNSKIIKVEPLGQSSLYLVIDGKYYTLLTTIKK